MSVVVVDSSVALKWFLPEAMADRAAELLQGGNSLCAPDLIFPECGNVLSKKIARGELLADDGRAILGGLAGAPIAVVPSKPLTEAALTIGTAHRVTVYDALYVALAAVLDGVLVTADERMVRAFGSGTLSRHVRGLAAEPA